MAVRLRITLDDREVRRALQEVASSAPRVAATAINKVLPQVRTEASREIRKLRKLSKSIVDRVIVVRKALGRAPTGAVIVTGAPISLKHYGARQRQSRLRVVYRGPRGGTVSRRSFQGVQVEVTPGKRETLKHAFIGPNGHVFERVTPSTKRLPIKRLIGPSLPTAMLNTRLQASLQRKAVEKLPPLLMHELERALKRARLA